MIATVTDKDEMCWKILCGALNAKILIDFLKRLSRKASRNLFLILDNLQVHHSRPVKQWPTENAELPLIRYWRQIPDWPIFNRKKSLEYSEDCRC